MIQDKFSLAGKVAVVTGGGRGIGRSIALGLAEAGADVAVTARTTEQIEQVAREIRDRGRKALPITTDIAKVEDIDRMVRQVVDTFGRIDVLVNAAGISPYFTRAEKVTPEMWDQLMEVNLRGLFFCCTTVGKVMIQQQSGSIVNVSSVSGFSGTPRLSAYSASKGGVIQITKTLALEWAGHNIRVNALAPGWIATEFNRGMRENPGILQTMLAMTPMNRIAEPDELAGAALFLASDASSYVTGTVLIVDGGGSAF